VAEEGGGAARRVIAIDGLAGAGKSTVSCLLAERLGLPRLDTGAMYRAVALEALRRGVALDDARALAAVARDMDFDPGPPPRLAGRDVGPELRSPEVTAVVSEVSAVPGVRRELVRRQRRWAEQHGGGVVEGRDIASVVFPEARLKAFLTATVEERARRRVAQEGRGDADQVAGELRRRDRLDSSRSASPLQVAQGAVVLDTTGLSPEEVVEQLVARL
jgi:cytidylate kinase